MVLWRNLTSSTRHAIRFASESEADGYTGIGVTDSQNLAGDWFTVDRVIDKLRPDRIARYRQSHRFRSGHRML